MTEAILSVRDLHVRFAGSEGPIHAVRGIDFDVFHNETLAIVGESGSGKSQSVMALMGLLAKNGNATGQAPYRGDDLLRMERHTLNQIRGRKLAMIFQEPMTSLDPLFTIGSQIETVLRHHQKLSRAQARQRAVALLEQVKIPDAAQRINAYPHEMSGGQRQRVMIAMALANDPDILIADEPTTALDVTIQAQILDLLLRIQSETGMALVLITHDMGVVAETAERVSVQYAGQKVEEQPVLGLFDNPRHPYTAALLAALPSRSNARLLPSIGGVVPGQFDRPPGCLFAPRCGHVTAACVASSPAPISGGGLARCFFPLDHGAPTGRPQNGAAA